MKEAIEVVALAWAVLVSCAIGIGIGYVWFRPKEGPLRTIIAELQAAHPRCRIVFRLIPDPDNLLTGNPHTTGKDRSHE